MKIRMLPSATDGSDQQFLTTFLLNDVVALDAGSLGLAGTPREQARVTDVVLTHSHADHVCSLPTFAMNVIDCCGRPTTVWTHQAVVESLENDLFNGRLWPDFLIATPARRQIVEVRTIEPRRAFD
ncbi:MAG TPA: MBL fold metallo-hydrolase, partial [Gemmatimonadaceae bacterium]|nr:MBL fold metallo-hydrolase [Gemmatimonadaceae bacterium]